MCSPCRSRRGASGLRAIFLSGALVLTGLLTGAAPATPLRVCADPNNLPFSNERREGFENRIAELVGRDLHRPVAYTWAPQWRGFVRKTLGAGRCDVVLGIPASSDRVLATRPYYTSTYVFLSRRDRGLDIRSLDDPRLRHLRIGIHFVGDDYVNPPPAHALARRHIVDNVVGYSLYGNYARPNPPADLVRAVARREVDLAIIWGPFAGYFAPRTGVPMRIDPVTPALDPPGLRFTFAIAAGVRPADTALRTAIDGALARRQGDIARVLRRYGVPLVSTERSVAAEDGRPGAAPAPCARGISREATCTR
ncbi:MAG TPA: substrate-binding domain-containing protein [Gemmatimonadales bacterium]|jgi:quinoprotein dehydrogenase-associated probable ABC transporter substrate-binding protein|nr:substrate-binding domain-containing protein [Gemmatimonadales bacterium]